MSDVFSADDEREIDDAEQTAGEDGFTSLARWQPSRREAGAA